MSRCEKWTILEKYYDAGKPVLKVLLQVKRPFNFCFPVILHHRHHTGAVLPWKL